VPGGWRRLTRGESHDGGTTWFDVAARFIGADKARADVRNLVEEPGPGGFGQCEGPEKSAPPPSRWKPAGLSRPACLKTPFWRHDTTRHPQGEVYGKPTRDISRYGLSGDARVIGLGHGFSRQFIALIFHRRRMDHGRQEQLDT
jgi:hypothetical protein